VGDNVEFRVLGPVEAIRDGRRVALGQGTLVDLLAALLVSANRAVTADDLVGMVWSSQRLAHPRAALHNGIARLRRATGRGIIETSSHGYLLRADADHLDMLRFGELAAEASQATSALDEEQALARALGLWHGRPLGNVESPMLLNTAARQITDQYLDACERWAELCLEIGRHDRVTARLTPVVEAYPFRERLAGQLMTALCLTGRQADALAVYASLRRVLAGEVGVDPSPAIQELHLRILRADPSLMASVRTEADGLGGRSHPAGTGRGISTSAVPRQLPADVPDFCGRETEARTLAEALIDGDAAPGETRIAVVSGAGGVGKSTLAVHLAHQLAEAFPDGQLFASLNGVAGSPMQPDEVLAGFLRALGVAGPAIPRSLSDRVMMYRSLVAGRRLLIVLDNAAGESQMRQLLPGSASCAVIVTSRARLTGLAGARAVRLGVFDDAQALSLLSRIIGSARAHAEAADVTALVGLCGGLPLALRIAGARLAAKPHWPVAELTDRLADTQRGLSEFVHGDLDMRASFALSYDSLDPAAKAMLRLVSLLDAPDFPAWAGAALLDQGLRDAADACERLVDAQLLDARNPGTAQSGNGSPPGRASIRYRLHDLVRAFARERAVAEEPDESRIAALARAFGGWLALAERAYYRVHGSGFTIVHGSAHRWTPGEDRAIREAVDSDPTGWLDGERHAIAAAVRQSTELGLDDLSWDLMWTAVTLYEARAQSSTRHALATAGREGAQQSGTAMLAAHVSILLRTRESGEVPEPTGESLRLFAEIGDPLGLAIARDRRSAFRIGTGEPEAAIRVRGNTVGVTKPSGDSVLQALGFRELAMGCLQCGDYQAASEYTIRSRRIFEEIGSQQAKAMADSMPSHVLGEVHLHRGELGAAEDAFGKVLAAVRADNDIVAQAHVLVGLGETLAKAGRRTEADRRLHTALDLARKSRQRTAEARALYLLGTLNPSAAPEEACSGQLAESLAIFMELDIPHWRQRVSAALDSLGGRLNFAPADKPSASAAEH
jgi:DNA-binding SARP family transcriptional activator/tetratricopeptide (TPR) repeat protein